MTISITLVPPSRGSAPATFSTDMDAMLNDLPTWTTQANALETNVNAKEATATTAASTATTQAGIATTQAGNAATSASTATTQAGIATAAAASIIGGPVTSVNGLTGIVTLTAATVGAPGGSGTSTGTNTGDQTSVTGNAGSATVLATARNIDGQSFNGSANITVIAPGTHAASSKATPVDADAIPLVDSAASNVLAKLTWANLKATLLAYFDPYYLYGSSASVGGISIFNYLSSAERADVLARAETLDVTAAFNTATSTARKIYFPAGTYILDGALLRSFVEMYGAGELTIFKAKAGSTNAVLITENFATLQTTYAQIGGSGPTYKSRDGSSDFHIHDLAINGGYVPTISSGGVVTAVTENASVSGLVIYGCNYRLENITISQCRKIGLYSEWSDAGSRGTGSAELEAMAADVKVLYCGETGVDWRGPHDSILDKINTAWCNLHYYLTTTGSNYPGFKTQKAANVGTANGNTAGGTTLLDAHVWGNSHTTGLDLLSTTFVRAGYFEQAKGSQIRIQAHGCLVDGNPLLASNQAVTTGQVGVEICNDVDSATPGQYSLIRVDCRGLPTSVAFTSSGGSNRIEINGYPENGSANAYTGTPHAYDDIAVNFAPSACTVTSHHTLKTKREVVAWATVNTAAGTISSNESMSYVVRYSTGLLFVGFSRDVGTTLYSVALSPGFTSSYTPANGITAVHYNRTTTGFNVATYNAATGAAEDCTDLNISVIGDSTKFI